MEFSVVALFILFRETVEASIIVSVLMQFLSRSFPHLKRQVWWGVAVGVFLSIIFGVVFSILFYVAKQNLFTGDSKNIFKGCIAWFAAILMTFLAFAMLRYKGWEDKIKRKLEKLAAEAIEKEKSGDVEEPMPTTWHGKARRRCADGTKLVCTPIGRALEAFVDAVERGCSCFCRAMSNGSRRAAIAVLPAKYGVKLQRPPAEEHGLADDAEVAVGRNTSWGIFLVVFSTVLREGIESVIFLAGVGNNDPQSLILPGLVGLVCGIGVGMFLYYTGKQVKDIKYLLIFMAVLLFFIAAGQVMLGTYFLMSGHMFGYCSVWVNDRPWNMQPVWTIKCCIPNDQKGNEFWMLARAIFGYSNSPSMLEITFYFGYWFIVLCFIVLKAFQGSLFDADYKYKRQQAKEAKRRALEEAALEQQLELVNGDEAAAAMAKKAALDPMQSLDSGLPGPEDSGSHSPASTSAVQAHLGTIAEVGAPAAAPAQAAAATPEQQRAQH